MRKLGISIYPDKSTVNEMKSYIEKASKAGFTRIFSCLLSVNKSRELIKEEFKVVNDFAKDLGFEIIVDVSPRVFNELGISYSDLSFFKEIGADGLRLDVGYGGMEESLMTFNPHNLKIEINMSMDTHYIDTIFDYQPNQYNLMACHNYYPHPYSGLGEALFVATTRRFKKYGLRTAAFVSSQNKNTFGPWPVDAGLVTLESHRNLPLHVQIKDFIAMNEVDDIIISNCYPSDEELQLIQSLDLTKLTLSVNLHHSIPEIEEKIVLEEPHFNRGDVSEYFIRSTQSRVKYKGHNFEIFNAPKMIRKGDIIIESSLFGHYAGELQIALQDMTNTGKSNVVGRIVDEELVLLDRIKPWQKFGFVVKS